jgi:aquaporin related protein
MCVTGTLPWNRGALFPAQMAGGLVGSALNSCTFYGPITVITWLTNSTSNAQGVFAKMFLTSLLVFVVLMLAAEKPRTTFIVPVGIGLTFLVAELCSTSISPCGNPRLRHFQPKTQIPYFTGGSLNPTQSIGPSTVAHDFPNYHYIY